MNHDTSTPVKPSTPGAASNGVADQERFLRELQQLRAQNKALTEQLAEAQHYRESYRRELAERLEGDDRERAAWGNLLQAWEQDKSNFMSLGQVIQTVEQEMSHG